VGDYAGPSRLGGVQAALQGGFPGAAAGGHRQRLACGKRGEADGQGPESEYKGDRLIGTSSFQIRSRGWSRRWAQAGYRLPGPQREEELALHPRLIEAALFGDRYADFGLAGSADVPPAGGHGQPGDTPALPDLDRRVCHFLRLLTRSYTRRCERWRRLRGSGCWAFVGQPGRRKPRSRNPAQAPDPRLLQLQVEAEGLPDAPGSQTGAAVATVLAPARAPLRSRWWWTGSTHSTNSCVGRTLLGSPNLGALSRRLTARSPWRTCGLKLGDWRPISKLARQALHRFSVYDRGSPCRRRAPFQVVVSK